MKLATVISNEIKKALRLIKAFTYGSDIETANYVGPGCIDFNPPKNFKAIFAKTGNNSEPVCIGYINKHVVDDLSDGEGALISLDGQTVKATLKTRKNGNLELNGDSDFMTRFSIVEEAYNQLKSDHDDLVSAFNQHMHATAAVGAPSPPTPIPNVIPASDSTGDISGAKVENVLTN